MSWQKEISVIAFDADDTLWENEQFFRQAEQEFYQIMSAFLSKEEMESALLNIEIKNLPTLGFGIKAFTLSMIQAAIQHSNHTISSQQIEQIVDIGMKMLNEPVHLIADIELVLSSLNKDYRLVMATKGDLLDQERKLEKSGLEKYFHHVEILSNKREKDYQKMLHRLDIDPSKFLMIGNSLKSDVLPILSLGAYAIHVPFHTTWNYEKVDEKVEHPKFRMFEKIKDILDIL